LYMLCVAIAAAGVAYMFNVGMTVWLQ
jgi:hypothetical protein